MSFGGYDPEWERKKAQSIRSLFNDLPRLSPVLEENESSGSSLCRVRPLTSGRPTQAYSPLPPLIIEKEVPRYNCDEPPEFYIKLEKKMRRISKKLFIDGQSVSSVPDSDMYSYSETDPITSQSNQTEEQSSLEDTEKVEISDDNGEYHSEPRNTSCIADNENDMVTEVTNYSNEKLKSTGLKRKSSDSEGAINNSKKSKNFENFRELTDISSSTSEDDESSPGYYRQVTFQADVHRDATDYRFAETTGCYENNNENNDLSEIDVQDEGSADLENSGAPDNSTPVHTSSETAEVEVMRTQRLHHSAGSLLYQLQEESPRELMVEDCRFEAQTEVLLHDATNTGFEHSLRRTSECHASSVERENSASSSEFSASSKRYKDASTQTSDRDSKRFKDASTQTSDRDEINRRILENIFVGTPIVAKVVY